MERDYSGQVIAIQWADAMTMNDQEALGWGGKYTTRLKLASVSDSVGWHVQSGAMVH